MPLALCELRVKNFFFNAETAKYAEQYFETGLVEDVYPRFLSGRGLLAALFTCVTADVGLNSELAC
jgi:hypothetical protein